MKTTTITLEYIEHYVIKGDGFYHIKKEGNLFSCWSGGCRIESGIESLELARRFIFKRSRAKLIEIERQTLKKLEEISSALKTLDNDYFNLGIYKNPNYHGFECNYFNGKKG